MSRRFPARFFSGTKISDWTSGSFGGGTVAFAATGGTTTTYSGYEARTFTGSGSFTVTGGEKMVDLFLIAGGAAGACQNGNNFGAGGGGAGGFLYRTMLVSSTGGNGAGVYTVTIGAGGPKGTCGGRGPWDLRSFFSGGFGAC